MFQCEILLSGPQGALYCVRAQSVGVPDSGEAAIGRQGGVYRRVLPCDWPAVDPRPRPPWAEMGTGGGGANSAQGQEEVKRLRRCYWSKGGVYWRFQRCH